MRNAFSIGGIDVPPGERRLVYLPVSKLSNHLPVTVPVHVLHGLKPGETLFVSAAIHGDELNGVEIIRKLLATLDPRHLSGTLLCVPVVNTFGFLSRSRYLPDRRDLNRSFPGSADGSLAARLAHLFLEAVAGRCRYGIDLHSAAVHRDNLPQIRGDFGAMPELRSLADAFGTPVILESPLRPGSLRKSASGRGIGVLVYEGGEGLRFDDDAIRAGYEGVVNVMSLLKMWGADHDDREEEAASPPSVGPGRGKSRYTNKSSWVRAPDGGVFRTRRRLGDAVARDDVIGWVANPYEDGDFEVRSPKAGTIIGMTTLPIVNMGDALFHIAWHDVNAKVKDDDAVLDEDEVETASKHGDG
jgi:predicted deacylase